MPRPRQRLGTYFPALAGGNPQGAVTLEDMGAQVLKQTFVSGTPGGVNVVNHSFNTTNVAWWFVPTDGFSFRLSPYEVTSPTATQLVFGLQAVDISNQVNRASPGRLIIVQQ